MKDNLIVSEKFYSIQGEGQTMGVPAVFLRLAGCNLLCKGAEWICDSIEVWKKGVSTPFNEVLTGELFDALNNGAHLVITGGEPMLHQKKLKEFLTWFKNSYGWLPVIEVETNGTIIPDSYFSKIVTYWNCSPKLESSGELKSKRFNDLALTAINSYSGSIFKFVITNNEDMLEILEEFSYFINMEKVVLMPAGENQKELNKTRTLVADLCVKYGLRYSERLHVVIWNKKTGV